jgi:hypothetical protein
MLDSILRVDLISLFYLYLIFFKAEEYDFKRLLILLIIAECLNNSFFGVYLISWSLIYIGARKYRRTFSPNPFVGFLFSLLGYAFIRTIYNLPIIIKYDLDFQVFLNKFKVGYLLAFLMLLIFEVVRGWWRGYIRHS